MVTGDDLPYIDDTMDAGAVDALKLTQQQIKAALSFDALNHLSKPEVEDLYQKAFVRSLYATNVHRD